MRLLQRLPEEIQGRLELSPFNTLTLPQLVPPAAAQQLGQFLEGRAGNGQEWPEKEKMQSQGAPEARGGSLAQLSPQLPEGFTPRAWQGIPAAFLSRGIFSHTDF